MVVITAVFVPRQGHRHRPAQLKIAALQLWRSVLGACLCDFSFVGFESSATLAKECGESTPEHTLFGHRLRDLCGSSSPDGLLDVFGIGDDTATLGRARRPFGRRGRQGRSRLATVVVIFARH